jgi:RHS repeat-associated protein
MVATAPSTPSSLAGPSAQGRSASRIASDRRAATEVLPENAVSEHLARRRPDHAVATCTGRTRPHRRDAHRDRGRFSGQTRIGRYSWARYYHPTLQRFISEDPVGFAGGDANLYAYVGNNPISYRDPSGLCADPGGVGLRYCIDAYIEDKRVRRIGAGDNRGTNPSGGTYRTRQFVLSNGGSEAWAGESIVLGVPLMGTANCQSAVKAVPLSGRKITVSCTAWNGWAFITGDPPLSYRFVIWEDQAGVARVVSASGTAFPSFEVYQYGGPAGIDRVYNYSHKKYGTTIDDLAKGSRALPLHP